MAGRDWTQEAFQLTIPPGAGPNDPRVEIGLELPADLVAYYAGFGIVAVGGIVFWNPPDYTYLILTTQGTTPFMAGGSRNSTNVRQMFDLTKIVGRPLMTFGRLLDAVQVDFSNASSLNIGAANTASLSVLGAGSVLQVSSGASLSITSLAAVNHFLQQTLRVETATGIIKIASSGALLQIDAGGLFTIDGVSAERALAAYIDSTASSAAIGAEATVLTAPSMTFVNGRAYRVKWRGQTQTSVANTTSYRVHQTNLGGTLLNVFQQIIAGANSNTYSDQFVVVRTAGTDLTDNLVLTLQASAGTTTMTASAQNVRWLSVKDCGAAADFPNAIAI